ncbi:MAG: YlbF family regulator [Alkalispirochaeta sp.]
MNQELMNAADTFTASVTSNETIRAFQRANRAFEEHQEIQDLRARFAELSQQLQQKQMDGTLTQAEISELRTIQKQVNTHEVTEELLQTQEAAQTLLGECNQVISKTLGFDFAATSAPAASC